MWNGKSAEQGKELLLFNCDKLRETLKAAKRNKVTGRLLVPQGHIIAIGGIGPLSQGKYAAIVGTELKLETVLDYNEILMMLHDIRHGRDTFNRETNFHIESRVFSINVALAAMYAKWRIVWNGYYSFSLKVL